MFDAPGRKIADRLFAFFLNRSRGTKHFREAVVGNIELVLVVLHKVAFKFGVLTERMPTSITWANVSVRHLSVRLCTGSILTMLGASVHSGGAMRLHRSTGGG